MMYVYLKHCQRVHGKVVKALVAIVWVAEAGAADLPLFCWALEALQARVCAPCAEKNSARAFSLLLFMQADRQLYLAAVFQRVGAATEPHRVSQCKVIRPCAW